MDWAPRSGGTGPRYLQIVEALTADIASGKIKPGARLLPQREMAERLDLSVGTISKAYAEAERRGLISGEVGRGTFVTRFQQKVASFGVASSINLALNVPPPTGAEALIAKTLAEIAKDDSLSLLTGYLPHQGVPQHRSLIADWLEQQGGSPIDPDQVFVTSGAQHAMSMCLTVLAGRGDCVLAEAVTYSGMLALAAHMGVRLQGVELDFEGVRPEALDKAFSTSSARVFYTMPTLQTPTGAVMSEARRREIAEIVRRHDAWLIEDDAYGFLFDRTPQPISSLIPERSFYIVSFAKCLAPGLRVGAALVPNAARERGINALRATGWMAPPIMAEIVARSIQSGALARQTLLKKEKARIRNEIAGRILGDRLRVKPGVAGFHIWVALPEGRSVGSLVGEAALSGVSIAGSAPLLPLAPSLSGVRLCLGAPESEAELELALNAVAGMLNNLGGISVV